MKCQNCGTINASDDKFCMNCGSVLIGKVNVHTKKSASQSLSLVLKSKLLISGIVAALLTVFILIPTLVDIMESSQYMIGEDQLRILYNEEDEIIVITPNEEIIRTGDYSHDIKVSLEGNTMAYLTDLTESGYTLYVISKDVKQKVSDDVKAFEISLDGSRVAYIINSDGTNGELYVYDVNKEARTRISKDVYETRFKISPDGKTISYISSFEGIEEDFSRFISKNGKTGEPVGKNQFPVAISNDAKIDYYLDIDWEDQIFTVMVASDEDSVKLGQGDSFGRSIFTNDFSEFMYELDGKTYIIKNGSEKVKVSNDLIAQAILPKDVRMIKLWEDEYILGINSFVGKYFKDSDSIYYLNEALETEKVVSKIDHAYQLSLDGKSLIYIDSRSRLQKLDLRKKEIQDEELAEEVKSFIASTDLKSIYYVNEEEELHYISSNSKSQKVADDADRRMELINDKTLYLLKDYSNEVGDLYQSVKGSKAEKVKGVVEVNAFISTGKSLYYLGERDESGVSELYKLDKKQNPVKLRDEIRGIFK